MKIVIRNLFVVGGIVLFCFFAFYYREIGRYFTSHFLRNSSSPHFLRRFLDKNKPLESTYSLVASMPKSEKEVPVRNSKLWGITDGWKVDSIKKFSDVTELHPHYLVVFVHWGNENGFPKAFGEYAKKNDMTLVIFWEAMNYNWNNKQNQEYSYDSVLKGEHDKYISFFAKELRRYDGKVILIPFEEMNGDWYAWSGTLFNNSQEKHIAAYQYISLRIKEESPNTKMGWAINSNSVPDIPENSIEGYYPGSDYVDYVGINGFNFGVPWVSFDYIFENSLNRLEKFNKPIVIFSMASMEGEEKAQWVEDSLKKINERSSIVGWIWFNEEKERNWSLWSDKNTFATFLEIMRKD